jgi:hypothetical protein
MSEAELEAIDVPDVAQTLLGFRAWRVRERDLTLWSVTRGDLGPKRSPRQKRQQELLSNPDGAWPAGEPIHAVCDQLGKKVGKKAHEVPADNKGCGCGVYASYDVDVVGGYLRGAPILGLIQGWGKVVPGLPDPTTIGGFRAQHAQIVCLFEIAEDFTVSRRQLRKLAERYQVPLLRPHSDVAEDYREVVRSGRRR